MQIPAIGLNEIVYQGTDQEQLAFGPGHYPQCGRGFPPPYCSSFKEVWPGERGRAIIGGHRTLAHADFKRVGELRHGDAIFIHAAWGRFRYRVVRRQVVDPSDRTVIVPGIDRRELALVTCHPRNSARFRLIVYSVLERGPTQGMPGAPTNHRLPN